MKKRYDCGIDLGTTNSCIAKPNADNTCIVIENAEGSSFTPSVVSINKAGRITVGARAKRITKAGDVRKEFKRDMGTDVQYTFESSGIKKTPVELSSEVLGQLKRDFESRFVDESAQDVVITVPAAFSLIQCEATKKAATEAGFRNVILLQEPIAASIAYGAQPDSKEQYWLVFDYGGGTLDVSIISTKDDHLDNINSRGDNRMGGKDLDRLLYEKVILPKIQEEYNLPGGFDAISTKRIMEDVENCKKELSTKTAVEFCPENLGEVMDEDGEFIDFTCTVTRDEFESAIRSVILETVSIARKALDESGIKEDAVERILLVGGSTIVPLVREELKKEFSIRLDCSLNPMTVVAEGAALFAASQVINDDEKTESVADGEYPLDLEYEPISSRDSENVCGRIIGSEGQIRKIKIDCIADENASNAIWSSGWSEILDEETGAFDIDVILCNKNATNLYRITALDAKGKEVKLNGYLFEIVHKESALKVLAPPMPHAIGVLANDGRFNIVKWFSEKNTKLPIEKTETFYLDKSLDPNIDDECEFVFYEGETENSINPKANHLVGKIIVQSDRLPKKVNKGAEVEITISIDISRVAKISAVLVDQGIELFADEELEGLGALRTPMQRMTELEKDMDNMKHTLSVLAGKGINVKELKNRFEELEEEYDKYLDMADSDNSEDKDPVNVYIQKVYSLQTELLNMERDSMPSVAADDIQSQVERSENTINRYGTAEQKAQLMEYKRQLETMKDPESKKFIADKIDELDSTVINNSFDWMKNTYLLVYESGFTRFTDNQKAEYWREQARAAILKKDMPSLKNAIIQLQNLRVTTVGEANHRMLADIRIR